MSLAVIIHEKGGQPRRQEFSKSEVTIGRVQGNDIILPKQNVSKRHSRIVVKDGKFIIVDLKSTNGTYVNGRKIASPMVIKETDKIYIGDFILSTEPLDAAAREEAAEPPPEPARNQAPPPPPRRQPPPPGPRPATEAPARPATPSPPAGRSRPPRPAAPKPSAAPFAQEPPTEIPEPEVQEPAAPVAAEAAAPARAASPSTPAKTLKVSAEEAPVALYGWVQDYAVAEGLDLPQACEPDSSLDSDISARLTEAAKKAVEGIPGIDPVNIASRAVAEVIGAGALTELLADASVESIYFNGPDNAWVVRGGEREDSSAEFSGAAAMVACVERLLYSRGLQEQARSGFLGGRLRDGSQLHLAMPSVGGPYLTIERPNRAFVDMAGLVGRGLLNENIATFLTQAMGIGKVILVSSDNLAARFDLLSALMAGLPEGTRVVGVESGNRLAHRREMVLLSNGSTECLVRNALQMSPERLVIGDLHGSGALTAVTALGGAVPGGAIGIDALSCDDALSRLASHCATDARASADHFREFVGERVDVVVQISTYSDGQSCVAQILDTDGEPTEVFAGFEGQGHVPRWYAHAKDLEHPLDPAIFG